MELFGQHNVTFDGIRAQAIYCHALDIGAHHLLLDTTHTDIDGLTKQSYEELFTSHLLALAISIRTKCYQGVDTSFNNSRIVACGSLYLGLASEAAPQPFTIKDVCDKIVHASSVRRPLEPGVPKPITELRGEKNEKPWELHLSVSLFSEVVLDWIQSL